MSAATLHGGCLCGAVRYVAGEAPIVTRICWCRTCQYFGTGHGTVNTWFHSDRVSWTGVLKDFPSIADSGRRMHRRFCPECGTHVFTHAEDRPELLGVRAGTLDDPALVSPAMIVWTDKKPHWARLDPSIPHLAGQPGSPARPTP